MSRYKLYRDDCFNVFPKIEPNSIDLILTDLPYGTTSNKWDSILPLDNLWSNWKSIIKSNGVIALTASQPFTSKLVVSNIGWYRHEWIWIKNRGSNFANTVREPMKEHEEVLIFSPGKWTYNKQMQERTGGGLSRVQYNLAFRSKSKNYREFDGREKNRLPAQRVPSTWQKFNTDTSRLHPTIKPVALMEYLIKTYSNPNDLILDCCMGSGTTGVAALNLGRRFIGIELDKEYYKIAKERISSVPKNT